MPGLAQLRRRH